MSSGVNPTISLLRCLATFAAHASAATMLAEAAAAESTLFISFSRLKPLLFATVHRPLTATRSERSASLDGCVQGATRASGRVWPGRIRTCDPGPPSSDLRPFPAPSLVGYQIAVIDSTNHGLPRLGRSNESNLRQRFDLER